MHASEQAPALPGDLLNDLSRRFNTAPALVPTSHTRSWFATLQSFVARPAFGVAALAVVVLGISLPGMIKPESKIPGGGFRGTVSNTPAALDIHIVLIQAPTGFQKALEDEGDFESGVITSTRSSEVTTTGPRILVDFTTSTITAINASDEKIHIGSLPVDPADISSAIAAAVSRL